LPQPFRDAYSGLADFRKTRLRDKSLPQRLKRLLKNSEKQIPHRLKPIRNDKNKGLNGTTEVVPLPKYAVAGVFQQPVKPSLIRNGFRGPEGPLSQVARSQTA